MIEWLVKEEKTDWSQAFENPTGATVAVDLAVAVHVGVVVVYD